MFTNTLFFLTILAVLSVPYFVSAAYTPLAGGLFGLETENLGTFFNNLFEVALTIGAVLAVLIIAVSGLQYMTTEAASGKGASRERMQQAVLGLLMLLSVWLFFSEINPDILNLNFTLKQTSVSVSAPAPATTPPTSTTGNDPAAWSSQPSRDGVETAIPGTTAAGTMHCAPVRGESYCYVNEQACAYTHTTCAPRPEGIQPSDENIKWHDNWEGF